MSISSSPPFRSGLAATRPPYGDGLREAEGWTTNKPNNLVHPCLQQASGLNLNPSRNLSKESDQLNYRGRGNSPENAPMAAVVIVFVWSPLYFGVRALFEDHKSKFDLFLLIVFLFLLFQVTFNNPKF